MNAKYFRDHSTTLIGYTFFVILFILSFIFWKERTIAFDAAFQIFNVLNPEEFAIQADRFGAVSVQILPLLLAKTGASTEVILKSYSASFILYPLLLFGLASSVFKNPRMGFSIVLFFLLMQVHTFYWIQSELLQGCVFSLFFISLFSKWPSSSIFGFIGYAFGLALILYAHPLAIIALLFGMGYLFLDDQKYRSRTFWGLALFLVAMAFYKYYFSSLGDYDSKAFGLFDGFGDRISRIFSLPSTAFLFKRVLSTYYILPIAMITVGIYFIKQRQWLKLGWIFIATLGWLILILTTYHWGAEQFYIESFYLMLGLFTIVPIAWDIWPKIQAKNKWLAPSILALLIIIRIGQIWESKKIYQQRLVWITEKLATMNTFEEQRFYMPKSKTPQNIIQMDWSIPYEMLLLSSLKDQTKGLKTLYISQEHDDEHKIIHTKGGIYTGFGVMKYEWLGKRFTMNDSLNVKQIE